MLSNPAQPNHEAKLDEIAVNEQELRPTIALAPRDRVAGGAAADALAALIRQQDVAQAPEEEEGVCAEAVEEDEPGDPLAADVEVGEQRRQQQRHDDADELVARVGDQVEQLRRRVDGQDEGAHLDGQDLQQHDADGQRRRVAQQLRVEVAPQPREQRREQDVRHQRHHRDVHVGRVDVLARGQVEDRVLCVGHVALLPRPGPVPPGEQHDEQLVYDVAV